MDCIISLFILLQLFGNIRTETVSFYFSVNENSELNTRSVFIIRSLYVRNVMLCARVCGAEATCKTANYNPEENKCDLFKERMEDISHGTAMTTAKRFYLITKVRICPYLFNCLLKLKSMSKLK